MRFGPIYAILGTKMAAVRPSWVASGKGWWRKMRIRPEHNQKIILSEIGKFSIFDPPHFGGQVALGSKCRMPLDSPWVVSYRCVIHYDAIFLTVSELDGLLIEIWANLCNFGN